ncbi:MAG: hypothetical protein RL133_857 [Pseudomonadota bacterium]
MIALHSSEAPLKMPTLGFSPFRDPQVRRAIRDLSPGLLAMAAWGLVTGLAMIESGLSTAHAVGMSLLVYAGAAQLASLPLIAAGAPLLLIWASALVINLRFLIYAVGQQPWMSRLPRAQRLLHGYFTTDILAVFGAQRAQDGWAAQAMVRYFRTGAVLCWVVWQTASLLGIFLASSLPREEGLRVLPALAILALLLPMIRSRPALACVLVSAIASLVFKGLPLNLGLFLATLAGVLTAVLLKRKAEQHG